MWKCASCCALLLLLAFPDAQAAGGRFSQTIFVANKKTYKPDVIEETMVNAWGVAIRPAGKGGHFWVTAKDTSFEYIGDVHDSADDKLRYLHTDSLSYVKLPVGGAENFATGVAFSDSKKHFVITQEIPGVEPVTAPAKFLFASDGGIISAWTERRRDDGTFDRAGEALAAIDRAAEGAQFFGLALNADYDRLYVADFGAKPGIKVFDGRFQPLPLIFDEPFDENRNGRVDPGEYAPFNVQAIKTPADENHIFVAYAKTQACPKAEIGKACRKGELFVGEEDTSKPGYGRIAEFTENGKLVAIWQDAGKLSAPWGFAFAPRDFGAFSGALLVSNFGSGKIAAYDSKTRAFMGYLRDAGDKPVVIDKVWGITFGNGESLGDSNALYFAAGPDDEKDGMFGSLRLIEPKKK